MDPVTLEFIVEGLAAFESSIKQANSALDSTKTQGNIFSDTFNTISDAIGNFAEKVWNVATVTLGVLLRDAINWIIGSLGDLARASLDAAEDLQGI